MLGFEERFSVLGLLKFLSILNAFPLHVDTEKWEIYPRRSKHWKAWACYLCYFLVIIHTLYTSIRFLHVFLILPEVPPLQQMLIHGMSAAGYVLFAYWYYVLFIKYADTYTGVMGLTLTLSIADGNL